MAENLTERLERLEQAVRRAAELITELRRERDTLQARAAALEAGQGELQRLRQERRDLVAQVDGMLRELDKLDL
jgi:DNA repair ATPase RecN